VRRALWVFLRPAISFVTFQRTLTFSLSFFLTDFADIFNEVNPAGTVTSNLWYRRALTIACSISVAAAVKRLYLGLLLGKKTYVELVTFALV